MCFGLGRIYSYEAISKHGFEKLTRDPVHSYIIDWKAHYAKTIRIMLFYTIGVIFFIDSMYNID